MWPRISRGLLRLLSVSGDESHDDRSQSPHLNHCPPIGFADRRSVVEDVAFGWLRYLFDSDRLGVDRFAVAPSRSSSNRYLATCGQHPQRTETGPASYKSGFYKCRETPHTRPAL
jgi:hypothetical protein